jgi:hypothetical protein
VKRRWTTKTRMLVGVCSVTACAALAWLPVCTAAAPSHSSNDAVLTQWGRMTGTEPPELAPSENGDTRLIWSANGSIDLYSRSIEGGELLTPYADGSFYIINANADIRQIGADDSVTWLQLDVTASNDRAFLFDAWQMNTLQYGRSGPGYQMAIGDVAVVYSTLGANTALRGIFAQRSFGDTSFSASAGVMADSWGAVFDRNKRFQFLRNSAAVKVERPLMPGTSVFVTAQGYSDASDSLPEHLQSVLPASARSGTAGFDFTRGVFSLQGEVAVSRFREEGGPWQDSGAAVADATWQWEKLTVRAGHHEFGRSFASLSSAALPGLQESYVNGSWSANPWVSLTADFRASRNRNATMEPPPSIAPEGGLLQDLVLAPIPASTQAATVQANVTIPQVEGLSALLVASASRGSNSDGGRNNLDSHGATLTYQRSGWTLSGGYQQAHAFNAAIADSNGRTRTWTASVGRAWSDASGLTSAGATLLTNRQRQDLDGGGRVTFNSATLDLSAQHARWGSVSASYTEGWGTDAFSQPLRQRAARLEGQRALGKRGVLKIYAAQSDNFIGLPGIAYREQVVGLQFGYTLGGGRQ